MSGWDDIRPDYWLRPMPGGQLSGPYTAAEARERFEAGADAWPGQELIAETSDALARYIGMCRPSDVASLAATYQRAADMAADLRVWPVTIDLAPCGEPEQFCTITYTPEAWILTAGPGPDVTG